MTREEILEKLKNIIVESKEDNNFDVSKINEDTQLLRDLGFDSFAMVYMAVILEQKFNCKINNEDYKKIKTVGDVIDIVLIK